MASTNYSATGSTGVIDSYIECIDNGSGSVTLKLLVRRADYDASIDGTYSVSGAASASGSYVLSSSYTEIWSKTFKLSVSSGTASLSLNFTIKATSPSSGVKTVNGSLSKVYFDSGGSGSGGDDDDDGGLFVAHLDVIIDEGIESVNIYKSWDEAHGNHGEDLSNGGWIYSVDDCIHVEISDIKVKPGYKLNMYSYPDGIDRCYQVSNLTLVTDGIHTWCLIMPYDASIIFTTTPQGLVYIDNGTTFEAYQVFIDDGSKWEQYMPYIDNGSDWDMCN